MRGRVGAPRATRGTTSLDTRTGARSSVGCDGPNPSGSTRAAARTRAVSSGGSPVMAGSKPVRQGYPSPPPRLTRYPRVAVRHASAVREPAFCRLGRPGRLDRMRADRVAVLSDIHGVLPALEAVLAEPDVRSADLIVLTGDHAAGPLPVPTLDLLSSLDNTVWVRGNADRELAAVARGAGPSRRGASTTFPGSRRRWSRWSPPTSSAARAGRSGRAPTRRRTRRRSPGCASPARAPGGGTPP